MKHLALLKSFAYLAFIIIAISKAGALAKDKKKNRVLDPQLNQPLTGDVVKVLNEGSQLILLVSNQGKHTWMITDDDWVTQGDRIKCDPVRTYDAYESTQHQMAFESVYLVKNLQRLS